MRLNVTLKIVDDMKHNYQQLRDAAHSNAVAKGFWENPNIDTFLMLIITEVSEVVEADRQGCFLTSEREQEYKSYSASTSGEQGAESYVSNLYRQYIKGTVQEELADVAIRVLDLAGGENRYIGEITDSDLKQFANYQKLTLPEMMFRICRVLCKYTSSERGRYILRDILILLLVLCQELNIDLLYHINEKMKYNASRPIKHGKAY